MKNIRRDFRSEACRNSTFSEHSHVAYQIKENQECSNMGANITPADTPADPGDWANRPKFNFFRIWSGCISMKGNHEMQQDVSTYFARRPLTTPTLSPPPTGNVVKMHLFRTKSCCISN